MVLHLWDLLFLLFPHQHDMRTEVLQDASQAQHTRFYSLLFVEHRLEMCEMLTITLEWNFILIIYWIYSAQNSLCDCQFSWITYSRHFRMRISFFYEKSFTNKKTNERIWKSTQLDKSLMAITNLGKHKKVLERGGRVGVVNHLFKTEKLYNIRIFVLIAIGKIMTLLCCHYLFVLFVHRCKSSIKIMNEILISTRMSTPVPTTYAYTHIVIFILLIRMLWHREKCSKK